MGEKKNPHFPDWKIWILTSLVVSQILTAVQIRQANEELWKAVIQQDEALVQLGQELVQQKQELTVKDKEIPLVPFLLLGYIIFLFLI